jgi:hypothetical protein
VATLRFDSLVTPTLGLGLRAAGGSAVRQLLFAVEGRDVDLRIEASGSGYWRVFGQVLGPDTAGTARWQCEGGLCVDATWSELAEFEFEAVPAGAATLVLTGVGWTTAIAVDAERT